LFIGFDHNAPTLALIASALLLNLPLLQGPLSHLFNDSDMSVFTGFIVGGVLYWILARVLVPKSFSATQAQ
jgi:cytosine/uracil/thiamine/allantoin permease